jgi:hypothetical protein
MRLRCLLARFSKQHPSICRIAEQSQLRIQRVPRIQNLKGTVSASATLSCRIYDLSLCCSSSDCWSHRVPLHLKIKKNGIQLRMDLRLEPMSLSPQKNFPQHRMASPCQTQVQVSHGSASIWKCKLTLSLDPPSRPSRCTHARACNSCNCGESKQRLYSDSLVKETVAAGIGTSD